MDETQKTGWGSSKVDLDAMSDEEIMGLVIAALGRLQPQQLTEVSEAVRGEQGRQGGGGQKRSAFRISGKSAETRDRV